MFPNLGFINSHPVFVRKTFAEDNLVIMKFNDKFSIANFEKM